MAEKDVAEENEKTAFDKPVFDEETLAKLLEAAYVLQEHNRELQKLELNLERQRDQLGAQETTPSHPPHAAPQNREAVPASNNDYTFTLAQIVETQHQIQVRRLDLESAMLLVVERATEIARAGGAAIGILEGKKVRYRAVAGNMALPLGTEVPMEKALCVACLRTGQVVRCTDVNSEFLLDAEDCQRRGIQSIIAVPVYHEGGVAGGLELYYSTTNAFTEQDVHTGQLMAGLITEGLARVEEAALKKSLASERAVMLEALEKLKPNLTALVEGRARDSASAAADGDASIFVCRKCRHQLVGEEQFCGKCGTPRSGEYEPPNMQSKAASLWQMQEAMKESAPAVPPNGSAPHDVPRDVPRDVSINLHQVRPEKPLADSIEEESPELFTASHLPMDRSVVDRPATDRPIDDELDNFARSEHSPETFGGDSPEDGGAPILSFPLEETEEGTETSGETSLAKPQHAWTSAATARDFLEQLAGEKRPGGLARFWKARRGDIYLAVAVVLVAVVIRWGIWSNHSVGATGNPTTAAGHRKPAPDADLSTFDRILIKFGLAEAPEPPEYKGNPDVQVWVDLHTALYYCPGADLYGKTPKGKTTTQRDAQLDQFEPAYGKTCE